VSVACPAAAQPATPNTAVNPKATKGKKLAKTGSVAGIAVLAALALGGAGLALRRKKN